MHNKRLAAQADFFDILPASARDDPNGHDPRPYREQVSLEELVRHQTRLFDMLALVRASTALPWPDLTRATVEEMGFHSAANVWFPEFEALPLRREFNIEMKRLWGAINDVSLYNDL